jgi:hypothetical protein
MTRVLHSPRRRSLDSWWGRDAEVESKPAGDPRPAGGPARRLQPTNDNDETVAITKMRLLEGNMRCNKEVEAKSPKSTTSAQKSTTSTLEQYLNPRIEPPSEAPGEERRELTIRRLGASRTVLGIVNVNPPATSHSAAHPGNTGRAALGCVRAGP